MTDGHGRIMPRKVCHVGGTMILATRSSSAMVWCAAELKSYYRLLWYSIHLRLPYSIIVPNSLAVLWHRV